MPEKYVPKHRGAPPRHVREGARKGARNAVYLSGVAAFATGLTVSTGVAGNAGDLVDDGLDGALVNLSAGASTLTEADLADRERSASRSSADRRADDDSLKADVLNADAGRAVTRNVDISVDDPEGLALALMSEYGLRPSEFDCLDRIWTQESNWNVHADNPRSSAYGIPQALPGSKMSSAGPDWRDNAETQIRWGLGYIENRYGSACNAWSFKQGHGWY